jgi:TfoX/Sxy family transcriptional regulator of competence genes
MAYDERLADELRERLGPDVGEVIEKRMFGGLAFMVEGHLTVAASRRGGLMVRTDPDEADEVLSQPGVEPMVMGGREMRGWIYVDPTALAEEPDLDAWLDRALAFIVTLPPK